MTTLPELARKASEALAEHSGDKQKLGLEVRVYVPVLSDDERKGAAEQLAARNSCVGLIARRNLSDGNRVLRTVNQLWNKEDQKVEGPG